MASFISGHYNNDHFLVNNIIYDVEMHHKHPFKLKQVDTHYCETCGDHDYQYEITNATDEEVLEYIKTIINNKI